MKLLFLIFFTLTLFANEKWIAITPLVETSKSKTPEKADINLSQIAPINKMLKNITIVKELLDARPQKEVPKTTQKNWFVLNTKEKENLEDLK